MLFSLTLLAEFVIIIDLFVYYRLLFWT